VIGASDRTRTIDTMDRSDAGKRLLICSAGVPHESEGASVVLFYHYIARLKREGHVIRHLLLLDPSWSDEAVDAYRRKLGSPGTFDVVVIRATAFYRSGRVRPHCDADAAAAAGRHARAFAPQAILCFDILAAWLLDGVTAAPRIVWLGDLNFETFFYHSLYATRENPMRAIHLPSNWLSCRGWRHLYATVLSDVDQVIVASHSSERALGRLGVVAEYEPYPWPTEATMARTAAPPARPSFLFFGQLAGLGSRSAFHFLMDKVFPLLRERWGAGGFRIMLAGRGAPPDWVLAAIADKPEIERLGFVEKLDDVLAICHAVLVPIDVPVGNRSRILTAMAMRSLIIAHANTALGNPDLVDGATCYLAGDAEGFVSAMAAAVGDPSRRTAIIERAFRCYQERFHPERATSRLAKRVETLFSRSAADASA
jgi:glycosyltransferase involved in cell wall biosynthesis